MFLNSTLTFRVPNEDPSGNSVILPRHEFFRIVQHSRVTTKEERQAMEEMAKREKEIAMVCIFMLMSR